MGGGSSRITIFDYPEAVRKMGRAEVAVVEEGFARLAVGGRLGREAFRTGFLNSLAGTKCPERFAAALFNAFDNDDSGYVTVEEFVCGLAVLRHGRPVSKLRLLCAVYNVNPGKWLSDADLANFASALETARSEPCDRAVAVALAACSEKTSGGFKRFADWAKTHIDSSLVAWIFELEQKLAEQLDAGDLVSSQTRSFPAPSRMVPLDRSFSQAERKGTGELSAICSEIGIEYSLGEELRATWAAVAADSKFSVVDGPAFGAALPSLPKSLASRFLGALDQSRSGTVSLREWVRGLGISLAGSSALQRELCFRLFADSYLPTVPAAGADADAPAAAAAAAAAGRRPEFSSDRRENARTAAASSAAPVGEPDAISASTADELVDLARSAHTAFDDWSPRESPLATVREDGQKSPRGEKRSAPSSVTLRLEDFDLEPWASNACAVVVALGHLARVDLKIRPRDPREERNVVDKLFRKFDPSRPGNAGETWYLISALWWQRWCDFTGPEAADLFTPDASGRTPPTSPLMQAMSPKFGPRHASSSPCMQPLLPKAISRSFLSTSLSLKQGPPSIDNSRLVDPGGWLRFSLHHHTDYEVLTEGAWRALYAWYGGCGPVLPCHVIELYAGSPELEIYPLRLRVSRTDDDGQAQLLERMMSCSRAVTLQEVREMTCALLKVESNVKVWHRSGEAVEWASGDEVLDATLHTLDFIDGHCILLEPEGHPGIPEKPPVSPRVGKPTAGEVGMQNLGNTCYMNASLQCLLHTPMLPEYFKEAYRYDLNVESTWGMAGKLAVAFADLLASIRRVQLQGASAVAPRDFRQVLRQFKPEFGRSNQQDAQEFLAKFLDGLHEDLNRVKKKPYTEYKDSEGRPDAEVATEYWNAHCSRDQSVLTALSWGQLKSSLKCVVCGHENVSFDPFSSLSVPLPEHNFDWVTCEVVRGVVDERLCPSLGSSASPNAARMLVCARVLKTGSVADLLQVVAGFTGLPEDELIAANADQYVFCIYERDLLLAELGDNFRPVVFHAHSVAGAAASREPAFSAAVADSSSELLSELPPAETPEPAAALAAPEARRALGLPPPASKGDLDVESAPFSPRSLGGSFGLGLAETVVIGLVHRRLRRVEKYFLNPWKPELFGTPLVLRVPATCSSSDLYDAAWRSVRHLVPDVAPPKPGSPNSWPFALTRVTRDGISCSVCSAWQGCIGCTIALRREDSADGGAQAGEVEFSAEEETLGIDWDAEVLAEHWKEKIEKNVQVHESVELAPIERSAPVTLSQCVALFRQEEELTAYCRECTKRSGDHTESQQRKSMWIWGCPPILVVQLKRFRTHDGGQYAKKIANLVTFPMTLDLKDYVAGCQDSTEAHQAEARFTAAAATLSRGGAGSTSEYRLYAVVNHIGGMDTGHYTAYVRTVAVAEGGPESPPSSCSSWVCFNDDRVLAIDEKDVVTANAYLLFYARSDITENPDGSQPDLARLFPPPPPDAFPVPPETIRRAKWTPRSDHEAASSGLGGWPANPGAFCGVM